MILIAEEIIQLNSLNRNIDILTAAENIFHQIKYRPGPWKSEHNPLEFLSV